MTVGTEPTPGMPPQRAELFSDSPGIDGYESLPEPDELTVQFLNYEVRDLDRLKNRDLNTIFEEYFKPYPRKPHSGSPPTPPGHIRLFRGERNRDEYNKYSIAGAGTGRWWSAFLDQAVIYCANWDEGGENFRREHLYYVDVPEEIAQQANVLRMKKQDRDRSSTHPYEFYIPVDCATGEKVEVKEMDWDLVDELIHDGEYTESGFDLNRDDLTEEDRRIAGVRRSLSRMAFSSIAGYWLYQNFQKNGKTATGRPVEKPRVVPDVKNSENLLARVCGWR